MYVARTDPPPAAPKTPPPPFVIKSKSCSPTPAAARVTPSANGRPLKHTVAPAPTPSSELTRDLMVETAVSPATCWQRAADKASDLYNEPQFNDLSGREGSLWMAEKPKHGWKRRVQRNAFSVLHEATSVCSLLQVAQASWLYRKVGGQWFA